MKDLNIKIGDILSRASEIVFIEVPESFGNLSNLTSLDLRGFYNLISLPESIGNLSNLTSFDLGSCYILVSLPETIGNISNLPSLALSRCDNFTSPPVSLLSLSYLNTPLRIAGTLPIPSWIGVSSREK